MLVISSREFRANQKSYLDQVDAGQELLILPVTEDTALIPKEYILQPDADLERAITGEELLKRVIPRIEKLFDK